MPGSNLNIASVVLASGRGSRFDGIKQLADIEGKPMLLKVVETQIEVSEHVVVVLGANADAIINISRIATSNQMSSAVKLDHQALIRIALQSQATAVVV